MTGHRRLIRSGKILTMDPALGDLTGDLLIEDGAIAAVAPTIACEDAELIDARHMIVAPGFVDTHRHVWQTQLRGAATDWSLFDYTCLMRHAYSASYDADDAYLGNYVGALEALHAGITTIVDHSHLQISEAHSDALVGGLKDAGIRGIYCHGLYINPDLVPGQPFDPTSLFARHDAQQAFQRANAERVRRTFFPGDDDLLRFGIAATEWVALPTMDLATEELAWSRRLTPARISIHIGMGLGEQLRFVPHLAEHEALGDDLLFVHGAHLTDADLRLLAECGGWVSSTPETELQMGMGYPVMERVAASGQEPSLGIDIASNFAGDMFAQMRLMLQTWRFNDYRNEGRLPLTSRFPARRLLHTATLGGATAAGLGARVGSLTPGKAADLILVRTDTINMAPMNDPVGALVLYANVNDVDSVFVAGRAVKRHGTLAGVDWHGLRGRLEASRDRIMERFRRMPIDQIRAAFSPLWEMASSPPSESAPRLDR